MKTFSEVYSKLRKNNKKNYLLLMGCCFFSVLLITAYVTMMRSPTVLNVLPEGGDSRKQVMAVFVLAVVGCGVFTTYASGLFFRSKSKETGVFMAMGASKRQLKELLAKELVLIALTTCVLGVLCGVPLAIGVWQIFRKFIVDTQQMSFTFDAQALLFALAFSVYVVVMLFFMGSRFIKRTNIIDIVNESRKSEPIKSVPRWYGIVGIALMFGGGFIGYLTPTFCVTVLKLYPPAWVNITYAPLFIGLYMILLHTVVNGWRGGRNRYKNIISTSMMKFQGRQTVRNMLVITVLLAGGYFAAFYTPMLGTGAMQGFDKRPVDYAYHYRMDQNMITQEDVEKMAAEENVNIKDWKEAAVATLGQDGYEHIEKETAIGITYTKEYRDILGSGTYISERDFNRMTNQNADVKSGEFCPVLTSDGDGDYMIGIDQTKLYNMCTDEMIETKFGGYLYDDIFATNIYVLDDMDYAEIAEGLEPYWQERYVFFNVDNVEGTYDFAKRLFYDIVDHSDKSCEQFDSWDPVAKMIAEENGGKYDYDKENLSEHGFSAISYDERDSSDFRNFWKYMPMFRVLDKEDFVKTMAVFLTLFILIAIICMAAVIVIAYTRCVTIAINNSQVYEDLRHLGATRDYLRRSVKNQVMKVYLVPGVIGTGLIYALYMFIMFFNDGRLSASEISGLLSCAAVVAGCSVFLWLMYRYTLRKTCKALNL